MKALSTHHITPCPHPVVANQRVPFIQIAKLKTNLNASNLQYCSSTPLIDLGTWMEWNIVGTMNADSVVKPQTRKGDLEFNQKMNLHG